MQFRNYKIITEELRPFLLDEVGLTQSHSITLIVVDAEIIPVFQPPFVIIKLQNFLTFGLDKLKGTRGPGLEYEIGNN